MSKEREASGIASEQGGTPKGRSTRRDVLQSLSYAGALTAAGAAISSKATAAPVRRKKPKGSGAGPNVVVAGFGAAGATAAVAAAQSGARVLVVDNAPAGERGGNTSYNSFYMPLDVDQKFIDGFVESLRGTAAPWRSYFGEPAQAANFWGSDHGTIDTWISESSPTISWLKSLGQTFTVRDSDAGFKPGLTPDGGGPGLLKLLEEKARALGVEFAYETALVDLEVNLKGDVTAAIVETRDGKEAIPCSSVILATGGYQGSEELMVRWIGNRGTYAPPLCLGGYYCKGQGLVAAIKAGAAMTGDLGMWTPTAMDARADGDYWSTAGFQMGIMVNRNGKRFTDESQWDPAMEAITEQPDGIAFTIVDARARAHKDYDILFVGGPSRKGLNYSMLHKTPLPPIRGATIAELASKLGVPEANLSATIAEYNAGCNPNDLPAGSKISDDGLLVGGSATRGVAIPKASLAYAIKDGPFEAWPTKPGNVFGLGGIKIDRDGRVLSSEGRAIAGLYSAGDAAAGYFNYYPWYSSTLKAIVFGRLSGQHAAKRTKAVSLR